MLAEHLAYASDLTAGIANLKARVERQIEDPGIRNKVLNSLQQADDNASGVMSEEGHTKERKEVERHDQQGIHN